MYNIYIYISSCPPPILEKRHGAFDDHHARVEHVMCVGPTFDAEAEYCGDPERLNMALEGHVPGGW